MGGSIVFAPVSLVEMKRFDLETYQNPLAEPGMAGSSCRSKWPSGGPSGRTPNLFASEELAGAEDGRHRYIHILVECNLLIICVRATANPHQLTVLSSRQERVPLRQQHACTDMILSSTPHYLKNFSTLT